MMEDDLQSIGLLRARLNDYEQMLAAFGRQLGELSALVDEQNGRLAALERQHTARLRARPRDDEPKEGD